MEELGWKVVTAWHNETFGEDGLLGRSNKSEVILQPELLKGTSRSGPQSWKDKSGKDLKSIEADLLK